MGSGKSRPEVVAMLGRPHGGTYWPEWDLAYYLGPERGWVGIDSVDDSGFGFRFLP